MTQSENHVVEIEKVIIRF